ncbi:threonine synthase [Patescibacteria group bacterium]|nr:threonine synthase [Patescibacteria group bacterium]MBU1028922.1 threonine synthase [Patescibacteria group bacterium]
MNSNSQLQCIACQHEYSLDDQRLNCDCGGLLDVVHDLSIWSGRVAELKELFRARRNSDTPADRSGIWRFRELVLPELREDELLTRCEGNTRHYRFAKTSDWLGGFDVIFKHEGENPTGSFKDRGMTVAMSWAKRQKAKYVVCASTGNTAAAVASYASLADIPAIILISEGNTALGKVAQSLAYGALTVKIRGDFDTALKLVLESREQLGLTVLNSVNPFRLEGQKTIIWEALDFLNWEVPDWIVVPGGNLGNTSAFGKALMEAKEIGLISKVPRLAVIQAAGAAPFAQGFAAGWQHEIVTADTIATAIRIGNPVNWDKAVRSIKFTNGVVTSVTDQEIMDAKAIVDSDGVGAEPASCASAAGLKKLLTTGLIKPEERAVAILTGHLLKDPAATVGYHSGTLDKLESPLANQPVVIDPTLEALALALAKKS